MKRIGRTVLAIAVALVAVTSLSAATWVWSTPYDNVTGYRYQIGSESEDGWIYVGSDVTSLTLDSKEETTIYVQLTVDNGRFWSPSGVATYVPQSVPAVEHLTNQDQNIVEGAVGEAVLPVIEDVPAVEETAAVGSEEVPADEAVVEEPLAVIGGADEPTDIVVTDEEAAEDEAVEEEAVIEEPAETVEEILEEEAAEEVAPLEDPVFVEAEPIVRKGRDFAFGMDIAFASEITVPEGTFALQPMLGFNFRNVASPADWFGLDLDFNLIGLFTPDATLNNGAINYFKSLFSEKVAMGGAAELVLRPTFSFKGCEIGILLGGGTDIYAATTVNGNIPALYRNDAILINAYALAGVDFRYNFNDTFNMGVGYRFKYTFDSDVRNGSQMSHSPVVSMGFTF